MMQSATPENQILWFGLFPFRSPLLRKSSFLSPPAGTQMFQFPASPFHTLCIYVWITELFSVRFPHSDISGSKLVCSSPKLFAAYHVFRRLLVPRHSPCALYNLTYFTLSCVKTNLRLVLGSLCGNISFLLVRSGLNPSLTQLNPTNGLTY